MNKNVNGTIIFEILRDCWQVVAVIFNSIENDLSAFFHRVFGKYWSNLWSVCFSCWLHDNKLRRQIARYMFVGEAVVALISMIIFYIAARGDIKYDTESQTVEMYVCMYDSITTHLT